MADSKVFLLRRASTKFAWRQHDSSPILCQAHLLTSKKVASYPGLGHARSHAHDLYHFSKPHDGSDCTKDPAAHYQKIMTINNTVEYSIPFSAGCAKHPMKLINYDA